MENQNAEKKANTGGEAEQVFHTSSAQKKKKKKKKNKNLRKGK